jgi:hypothetical protein
MNPFTQFLHTPLTRLAQAFATILSPFKRLQAPAAANVRPAYCGNILTLVAHLCDMDDDLQQYVLRWLAYPLRNPGAKMSTALVFNGGQGSGKNLFFTHVIAALYGDNAATIRPADLYGKFNYWAVGANLVVVDGDYAPRHLERMKAFQATESFAITLKGHEPRTVVNRLNFVYLSNREDFLPADTGNRRFVVVEVPPARPRGFYQAIAHEIANGGLDAFRDYLMHRLDMGDFNVNTRPPSTPAPRDGRRAA